MIDILITRILEISLYCNPSVREQSVLANRHLPIGQKEKILSDLSAFVVNKK